MSFLILVLGCAALIVGAEALVRGAAAGASALGVSPLVVGLTVVAFGTSSPELAVSVGSALAGESHLAVGNVVGSNIFNVLLILGLSALVTPLVVSRQLVRLDVPLMIGVSALALGLGLDGRIGRLDAATLVLVLVGYLFFLFRQARRGASVVDLALSAVGGIADADREPAPRPPPATGFRFWIRNTVLVAGGLGLLVLGAGWLVDAATTIAREFGISELVIGLTIVAGGTSLPEVATSVLASIRGERDIAVGNVVGSNIFNLLAVLGGSALVAPKGLEVSSAALAFDIPVMLAVAVACLPIFFTGRRIARWEGGLFLGYYGAYLTYLILHATDHPDRPAFSVAMWAFVLPLTALTLAILAARELGRRRRAAG